MNTALIIICCALLITSVFDFNDIFTYHSNSYVIKLNIFNMTNHIFDYHQLIHDINVIFKNTNKSFEIGYISNNCTDHYPSIQNNSLKYGINIIIIQNNNIDNNWSAKTIQNTSNIIIKHSYLNSTIISHEIGHIFGLKHWNNCPSNIKPLMINNCIDKDYLWVDLTPCEINHINNIHIDDVNSTIYSCNVQTYYGIEDI